MTVNEQVDGLPLASAKVYRTMVAPSGKEDPGVFVRVTKLATPEISTAVGSIHVTDVEPVPSSVMAVRSVGQF